MNKLTVILCFISLCILKFPVYPEEELNQYSDIGDQINNHWMEKNHVEILQIIEGRLTENPDDVFGLVLKRYYYTYAECDLLKARTAVDKLFDVVSALSNNSLTEIVLGLKNETNGIPLNESVAFTQAETDAIHVIFPIRFPGINLCIAIALGSDLAMESP